MRRIIAGVVIVIVIVLILIGVSSCSSSANKSALESYTSNVNSLIKQSQNNSKTTVQQGADERGQLNGRGQHPEPDQQDRAERGGRTLKRA